MKAAALVGLVLRDGAQSNFRPWVPGLHPAMSPGAVTLTEMIDAEQH